jgi:hypothetical protein
MEISRGAEIAYESPDSSEKRPTRSRRVAPSLFRHEALIKALDTARGLDQSDLTNILNHLHFTDAFVNVLMGHPQYKDTIMLRAFPEPCMGSRLKCLWDDDASLGLDLQKLHFRYLIIDDGRSMVMVPGSLSEITAEHIVLELPEKSFALRDRGTRRYGCRGIAAELLQSGFDARGELVDFSPSGFRMKVRPEPPCSFRWLNIEEDATVQLKREGKLLFSGACRFVRQGRGKEEREIVLAPLNGEIRRYRKRACRNLRQQLNPAPRMLFTHPLLGRRGDLEISDISTSGFAVCEETDERMLLPGMILPEVTVSFAGFLKMNCSAQVIYSKPCDGKRYRSGLAILDMDIHAYSSLTHVLTNALDPHANVSSDVNMDALWEFFFDTGFIYPKKYRVIQHQRASFKETYQKLYQDNPEVARHFTYQKNGRIYGHISMVRAYENAWMIHHHAAKAMERRRTGFMVLKLIMHYLNDMHRLPSANMDYAMCYFRPENKFPDRVFGGFARELNDPKGCSLDLFAYLPYTRLSVGSKLPGGWALSPASDLDLWEYERIYRDQSDGLLLDALGLVPPATGHERIEQVYHRLDLLRKCNVFSLSHDGELCALLVSNHSNFGFNLSELLNGIKVLVAKPEILPWSVLSVAIAQLAGDHHLERIPILFHPTTYVEGKEIPYEKLYQLWILNVQRGNEYMEYIQRRFHISYKQP